MSWPLLIAVATLASVMQIAPERGWIPDASALDAAASWVEGLWPPAVEPEFLVRVGEAALATLLMASLGTLGAHLLGIPLALLGNARLSISAVGRPMSLPGRAVRLCSRSLALLLRGVPDLVWALLLVRLVGLGPLAGTLAIALGGAGLVAKMHAEVFESVSRAGVDSAFANGWSRWQTLLHALLPRARDELVSYSLYRWECALRSSAVLGLVGAGGLGQELDLSLRFFAGDEVATLLIVLIVLVLLADALVAPLRSRGEGGRRAGGRFGGRDGNRRRAAAGRVRRATLGAGLLAALGAAVLLDDGIRHGVPSLAAALPALAAMTGDFLPPQVPGGGWAALLARASETLAMSFLGTLLAAGLAFTLAMSARAGPRAPVLMCSAVLRAVPELFWALLLLIGFGLGPLTGCLAIAVHNAGVLTRLFLGSLDTFEDRTGDALRGNGSSRTGAWLFGTWPSLAPRLLGLCLYRWEHAIRAAAVLGVVGAGGLGQSLHVSLSLFRLQEATGTIGTMLLLVLGVDLLSFVLRRLWVS